MNGAEIAVDQAFFAICLLIKHKLIDKTAESTPCDLKNAKNYMKERVGNGIHVRFQDIWATRSTYNLSTPNTWLYC